jgi:hypothetical protein
MDEAITPQSEHRRRFSHLEMAVFTAACVGGASISFCQQGKWGLWGLSLLPLSLTTLGCWFATELYFVFFLILACRIGVPVPVRPIWKHRAKKLSVRISLGVTSICYLGLLPTRI